MIGPRTTQTLLAVVVLVSMPAFGQILPDYRISGDGTRVLWRADQEVDGLVELYMTYLGPPQTVAPLPLLPPRPGPTVKLR